MWCGVWKSLHVYEGCIFHEKIKPIAPIKDGNSFIINANKCRSKISLISANEAKKLISASKKYVFIFLRESQSGDESIRVKESLEGSTKDKNHQL